MKFAPLSGGNGCSLLSAVPGPDLAAAGYTETEYAVSGSVEGVASDGPVPAAEFTTRILVRRPADGARFNGTVVVEWLNVSSGNDTPAEYTYVAPELVRGGYVWVGVSAQFVGVEGGSGSVGIGGDSLATKDPDRYGSLHHPGDAYCHTMFAAIAGALRTGTPLAGLSVEKVLAIGESQSAMALTTYVNTFAAQHGIFDGFLIHSRALAGLPLGPVGGAADIAATFRGAPTPIDGSVPVPVFTVQTETDLLTDFRFHLARQRDSGTVRTWEVAGSAHADLHQVGPFEEYLGCPQPVNRGQQRFVLRAALRHLNSWVHEGTAPPVAPPLSVVTTLLGVETAEPFFDVDELGNARGGVRTPCVEAPTQVLSGIVPDAPSRICMLFGSTGSIPGDTLHARYGSRQAYLVAYRAHTDAAITAGFALADDRDELLADARPDLIPE
ncbi:alpha/beta hydrolase domain-containing protein [Gordonia pseudamarae]|jgi:hypothetical protein|uniref:Alpha/beta hydrolase domain-containing protein n=1 Tax=Gordonia pseudamarae TaxID=2831662 RepID=A0ABX6IM17_9ACTN|nr:alpha/beta hydrolase domain-containing protein [Gordonia pseudamarae]QHN36419.1 hypothetical protein GII31_17555 [Gordonia pseudamarae]